MGGADERPPVVAGRFYPAGRARLERLVRGLLDAAGGPAEPARAVMVPHAGLVYSGRCAARVLARVAVPDIVVIVAPNHTGRLGAAGGASLWARGGFATPLGVTPIAREFAERLERRCRLVRHDPEAHLGEHAVEVELPFLSVIAPRAAVVPLLLAWDDWTRCEALAAALAHTASEEAGPVLLLASSDMSHYEPASVAARMDRIALDALERLDGAALLAACRRERITMCGRAAAAVVAEAARRLGAARGEVMDYRHSGWVTGDDSSVVGYAGVVIR